MGGVNPVRYIFFCIFFNNLNNIFSFQLNSKFDPLVSIKNHKQLPEWSNEKSTYFSLMDTPFEQINFFPEMSKNLEFHLIPYDLTRGDYFWQLISTPLDQGSLIPFQFSSVVASFYWKWNSLFRWILFPLMLRD